MFVLISDIKTRLVLGGKINRKLGALKPKAYNYLTDNNNEDKKAKNSKWCIIKKNKFED